MKHTANEQLPVDERFNKPLSPGTDETSMPFLIRASVTLKLVGSKELANVAAIRAYSEGATESFMIGVDRECSSPGSLGQGRTMEEMGYVPGYADSFRPPRERLLRLNFSRHGHSFGIWSDVSENPVFW
jgi:hypothetical protein